MPRKKKDLQLIDNSKKQDRNFLVRFEDGFDPREIPGYPAFTGTIGYVDLGNPKGGCVFVKKGDFDTEWGLLETSIGSHEHTRVEGSALVPASALPGSGTLVVSTDQGLQGFDIPDNQASLIQVTAIAAQRNHPKGVSPEGGNGCTYSTRETFIVLNDGVTLHIYASHAAPHQIHTDHEIYNDSPAAASNDGDMGIEFTSPDKNTLEVRAYNGTDNGGGDSGREMQWSAAIVLLEELAVDC